MLVSNRCRAKLPHASFHPAAYTLTHRDGYVGERWRFLLSPFPVDREGAFIDTLKLDLKTESGVRGCDEALRYVTHIGVLTALWSKRYGIRAKLF